MDISTKLDQLELKIRQLASKQERQKLEFEALTKENKQLKNNLDRQQATISALRQKLEVASKGVAAGVVAQPVGEDPSSSPTASELNAAREHIDFCLREIDRCITWLKAQ